MLLCHYYECIPLMTRFSIIFYDNPDDDTFASIAIVLLCIMSNVIICYTS